MLIDNPDAGRNILDGFEKFPGEFLQLVIGQSEMPSERLLPFQGHRSGAINHSAHDIIGVGFRNENEQQKNNIDDVDVVLELAMGF